MAGVSPVWLAMLPLPAPAPVMEERAPFQEEVESVADAAFDAVASKAEMESDDLSIADDLPPPAYRPQPVALVDQRDDSTETSINVTVTA